MNFIYDLVILTGAQLLSMFGIFFVFGFFIYHIERQIVRYIYSSFGKQDYLITAWIGVPVHEFGHYIMCKVFRHRVEDVQWFPTNPHSSTLGYVDHSYNEGSLYQRIGVFFISIAPLISGMFVLNFFIYLLLPSTYTDLSVYLQLIQAEGISITNLEIMFSTSLEILKTIVSPDNLQTIQFWIFMIIAVGICTHMLLSSSDLRGGGRVFWTISSLLFIVNLITILLGVDINKWILKVLQLNTYILGMMIFVLCLSLLTLLVSWIIHLFKNTDGESFTDQVYTTNNKKSTISSYRYKKDDLHNKGRRN